MNMRIRNRKELRGCVVGRIGVQHAVEDERKDLHQQALRGSHNGHEKNRRQQPRNVGLGVAEQPG